MGTFIRFNGNLYEKAHPGSHSATGDIVEVIAKPYDPMSCPNCERLKVALNGAFHRESCKEKGLGICPFCIEAIKNMEDALALPSEPQKVFDPSSVVEAVKMLSGSVNDFINYHHNPIVKQKNEEIQRLEALLASESGGKCAHDEGNYFRGKKDGEYQKFWKNMFPSCPLCAPVKKEEEPCFCDAEYAIPCPRHDTKPRSSEPVKKEPEAIANDLYDKCKFYREQDAKDEIIHVITAERSTAPKEKS